MTVKLRTVAILVSVLFLLAAMGTALFIYFGVYNIAATVQHTKPVYQLLDYAMRRAVIMRASAIDVPDLTAQQRIIDGAAHYHAHCLQCHGAPGIAPHSLAFGMTPEPVNLVSTAREWRAAEIYWVVRYGIKMSGMPSWEYQLSEDDIWDVVAFVKAMSALSPKEYAELSRQLPKQHRHAEHGTVQSGGGQAPAAAFDIAPKQASVLGNSKAGREAIGQYLCATCHEIPGIVGANRHVGPPLNGIATRKYIAGILNNTPENMVDWLRYPQRHAPFSAMPNLGLSDKDARDIAAYLYTLDDVE